MRAETDIAAAPLGATVRNIIAAAKSPILARSLWFLDTRVEVKVSCEENLERLSVLEVWAPYGASPPLHIHANQDEVFHVIEGVLRLRAGSDDLLAGPGETLRGPKGVPHSYRVESTEGARWLVITVGNDFERFVRDLGRTPERDGLPDALMAPTPEEVQALADAAGQHGIALIGPPLS